LRPVNYGKRPVVENIGPWSYTSATTIDKSYFIYFVSSRIPKIQKI
jgi:hypothetical protein